MAYELMDLETANLVGVYPTEPAALADIAEIVRLGDASEARCLGLAYVGSTLRESRQIATGDALVQLATTAVSSRAVLTT